MLAQASPIYQCASMGGDVWRNAYCTCKTNLNMSDNVVGDDQEDLWVKQTSRQISAVELHKRIVIFDVISSDIVCYQ